MSKLRKIAAGIGGLGVLALAIWIGTVLFIVLLIVVPLVALYMRWKLGKARKEFEQRRAEANAGEIEVEYVVVEETQPLDETDRRRP